MRGMNVTFVTTAKTDEESRKLLQYLGMPFRTKAKMAKTSMIAKEAEDPEVRVRAQPLHAAAVRALTCGSSRCAASVSASWPSPGTSRA